MVMSRTKPVCCYAQYVAAYKYNVRYSLRAHTVDVTRIRTDMVTFPLNIQSCAVLHPGNINRYTWYVIILESTTYTFTVYVIAGLYRDTIRRIGF